MDTEKSNRQWFLFFSDVDYIGKTSSINVSEPNGNFCPKSPSNNDSSLVVLPRFFNSSKITRKRPHKTTEKLSLTFVHGKEWRTELWPRAGWPLAGLTHKVSDSLLHSHQPLQLMIQLSFLAKEQMTSRALRLTLESWKFHMVNHSERVFLCGKSGTGACLHPV